jgi:hypothetical protein
MPQLSLYQTEEDELNVVNAAFEAGCWIVPDLDYEAPEAQVLKTGESFKQARRDERHFFILHKRFMRSPLHMRQILKHGRNVFYVSPSEGGPFLEFLGGGIIEDNESNSRHIRSGFLAYSSSYWDAEITKKEESPPELADTYKQLSKVIRATSTRIKPGRSVFWLGNYAKAQLLTGTKLSLHDNWTLPTEQSSI